MNDRNLNGLSVEVSRHLVGSKKAFRQGNTIYVSPAMYDLIKHAAEDELRTLLERIEVVTIPAPPDFFSLPLPMVSQPPNYNYAAARIDAQAFLRRGQ
jgi:hypothetical protein